MKPTIPEKETAFTENELYDLFGAQTMGGIRYTNKHDRVLLVDARSSIYTDLVDLEKGTVIYTGTGEEPQSFEGGVGRFNERVRSPESVLLYFHKPHRPPVPHLFKDEGPHSIRHIAENLILELVRSSLERNDQILLIDLPQQGLDLAICQPAHLVKDKDQIAH